MLMHGGGFGGPEWSVRVSLANLREETYPKIGQYLKEAAQWVRRMEGLAEGGQRRAASTRHASLLSKMSSG